MPPDEPRTTSSTRATPGELTCPRRSVRASTACGPVSDGLICSPREGGGAIWSASTKVSATSRSRLVSRARQNYPDPCAAMALE